MEYKFNIIIEEESHLRKFLNDYNNKNHTNFEIDEIIYDEVVFARLKMNQYLKNEILKLGIHYGKEIAILRLVQ